MSRIERSAATPSPKTGSFATLVAALRQPGIGAPSSSHVPLALALVLALTALLALTAAPAFAAPPPNFCPPGPGAGQCESPRGVAVDNSTGEPTSGDVYLADRGNNRIAVFDKEGHFIRVFGFGVSNGAEELQTCTSSCQAGIEGTGAGQFKRLSGVAVDNSGGPSAGDLYVTDLGNHRVEKFTPAGQFLLAFGKGVNTGTSGNPDVCTNAGPPTNVCGAGTSGSAPGQLNGFNESPPVAVDASGQVWVGDVDRLEKFGEAGAFLSEVALPGAGNIPAVAIDTDPSSPSFEDLYVLNERVREEQDITPPPSGSYELTFEGETTRPILEGERPEEALQELPAIGPPSDVAGVGPGGLRIFFRGLLGGRDVPQLEISSGGSVTTTLQGVPAVVSKLSPAGTLLETIDESGHPWALGLDPASGDLFLSDYVESVFNGPGCPCIRPASLFRYDSSGSLLQVFGTGGVLGEPSGNALAVGDAAQRLYVAGGQAAQIFPLPEPGPLPEENSERAEPIAKTTATLNANVNPEGHPTTVHFEYVDQESFEKEGGFSSPHTEVTTESASVGEDFTQHPASVEATGLSPGVAYRFRLVATNHCDELEPSKECVVKGEGGSFSTLPPLRIDATFATEVSSSSATLVAELNPLGDPATYRFEYLTQAEYEANLAAGTDGFSGPNAPTSAPVPDGSAGSGSADVTRSVQLQGLSPSTAYRYRVLASNAIRPAGIAGPVRAFTTQGAAASLLPDDRAWELVTPPNKHGAPLEPITFEGGLIQAAADGSAFASVATGPLGPESQGSRSFQDNQFLSRRGPGGWSTQDITTPYEEISLITAGAASEYQFFAADLSAAVVEPKGATPLSPLTTEKTPYRRESDGEYVPLVTSANVPPESKFGGIVKFETATPDLGHTVLSSLQLLTEEFKPGFKPKDKSNIYELSAGALRLISVLPNGKPAAEAGLNAEVGNHGQNMRGAISSDGQRVFFTTPGQLLMRANATAPQSASGACDEPGAACTLQLDAAEAGCATCQSGGGSFQAASADGGRAFFTDTKRLTEDSTATSGKPDLYMCEIPLTPEPTCTLTDLSVDHNVGEAANVLGMVSAIDASGGHAYFAASGVLTDEPNEHGEHALVGGPNLYEYDTGAHQLQLIAVLSSNDGNDWVPGESLKRLTARSSPDGRYFAFMSERSLTDYDNRDARSGQPDQEVYLFDSSSGALRCVSCNPTGARPRGVFDPGVTGSHTLLVDHGANWSGSWLAGSIPGWTNVDLTRALYQSRYLSNSGRTFFNSSDALVPSDTNGTEDVYQYEPPGVGDCTESSPTYNPASAGCVSLISSGTSPEESAFLDASENGNDVFFLTQSRLTPKDIDGAFDVYDASVGGGEPPIVNPPACEGDACQQPAVPPSEPTLSTSVPSGPGNLLQCPKGKVKKSGKCVGRHRGKKHKKHAKAHRHANTNRGAGK